MSCDLCKGAGVIRVRLESTPRAPAWTLCPVCHPDEYCATAACPNRREPGGLYCETCAVLLSQEGRLVL